MGSFAETGERGSGQSVLQFFAPMGSGSGDQFRDATQTSYRVAIYNIQEMLIDLLMIIQNAGLTGTFNRSALLNNARLQALKEQLEDLYEDLGDDSEDKESTGLEADAKERDLKEKKKCRKSFYPEGRGKCFKSKSKYKRSLCGTLDMSGEFNVVSAETIVNTAELMEKVEQARELVEKLQRLRGIGGKVYEVYKDFAVYPVLAA